MYRHNDRLIFSASDLVAFLGCRHATWLDRLKVTGQVQPPQEPPDPYLALVQDKGNEHERKYLETLRGQHLTIGEIPGEGTLEARTALTKAAMAAGVDVIYQGAFMNGHWHGYSDFLRRVPGASALGDYHYEPIDTKLAHSAKPKHLIQLGIYAELLTTAQGRAPEHVHVALGTGETVRFLLRDFEYYLRQARARFGAFAENPPETSTGEPCPACEQCRWRSRCESEWAAANHLSLVAGISTSQIEKLSAAGVTTVAALAALADDAKIERVQPKTLEKLTQQARLQESKRLTGKDDHKILPLEEGRGFARLPKPNPGDLFFDIEGDPLAPGGLEYLFGFVGTQTGDPVFTCFWGHESAQEKVAFEQAMDFIGATLAAHPDAHIYHYAAYEETALKRLAMLHGTREAQVDDLLRNGKLVDLFKIVREGLRVSEPSYSLKNIEVFYMPPRTGEVQTAGASVVMYETWLKTGRAEQHLLEEIEAYNRTDCISTLKLRDWLLTLRPAALPWRGKPPADAKEADRTAKRTAREEQLQSTTNRLLNCQESERPVRQLLSDLLEFHHREAKPQWWWQFRRVEMDEQELIDDAECIGGLRPDPNIPPFNEKKSVVRTFSFPPQDFKMRIGDHPRRAPTREHAGEIFDLDEETRRIQLKMGPSIHSPEILTSLIPGDPFGYEEQRKAMYRYADAVLTGADRYHAITALLQEECPRLRGRPSGSPVLAGSYKAGADMTAPVIEATSALEESYLLVQGPPGAGKTYVAAAAIVELLHQKKRVGISSNSHKAINKLLDEVAVHASRRGVTYRGVKKCSKDDHESTAPMVANVEDPKAVTRDYKLVAGTAWLFARQEHDQTFDYLFVDEAGQVSLGNLVAMGTAAKNLVLIGDQMQLSQPIKGTHPGRSGLSALDFLLGEHAVVPAERGIFLAETRRMNADVCEFISKAVYEDRLHSHPSTGPQRLVLSAGAHPALQATGLSFVPVHHEDCRQKSEQEAVRVLEIVSSLLKQSWVDRDSRQTALGLKDILVVTPYNMQVNLLQQRLPAGARVGTVDKFQGQEAAVVIVSMATSSAEDCPRDIEFLYSRNRLNVAISRAKSLAIVVASPRLLEASCSRIEQMALVNTLCHAQAYAGGGWS
jgi:uncharacterized protein